MGWETDMLRLSEDAAKNMSSFFSPTVEVAKVLKPPPEMEIELRGLVIPKEMLWMDAYWLEKHERTADFNWSSESGMHDHPDGIDTKIKYKDTFCVGDEVAILPFSTRQQYLVLGKVVKL